jgi:hypothetical protein
MSPSRESEAALAPAAVVRFFKIERRDLVYLKFILEAYEGMSTLSTVEAKAGIVRLAIQAGFEADIQSVLDAVGAEIPIHELFFAPGEELSCLN